MSANPAVRLIVHPLRKCIDATDYVDTWREKNKGKIAEAMSDPKNHRKSVTTKEICVDGSLSIQDRFGLTTEIEMVAAWSANNVSSNHLPRWFSRSYPKLILSNSFLISTTVAQLLAV